MMPVMRPRQPLLTDVTVWRGVADHDLDRLAGVWTSRDGWWVTREFLEQTPNDSLWAPFRPWVFSPGAASLSHVTAYAVDLARGDWMPQSLFSGIAEQRSPDQYALNGWELSLMGGMALTDPAGELVTLPSYADWARFLRLALGGFELLSRNQFKHPLVNQWVEHKGILWAHRLHLPGDDPTRFVEWLEQTVPASSRPDRWPLPPRRAITVPMPLSHRLVDWLSMSGRDSLLERARVVEGLWDMCMLVLATDQALRKTPESTIPATLRQALSLLVTLYHLYREAAFNAQILAFCQPRSREE